MFRWLHLSDIHVGMTEQGWLWPTLKHALYDDLGRLLDKTGPADLLVFSGDLAQQGKADEFARFTDVLQEIRGRLATIGAVPPLVTCPGNHDLARPRAGGPLEAALRHVPGDESILREVWKAEGDYLEPLRKVFANYVAWQEEMIAAGIHAAPVSRGPMPGDMSFQIAFDEGVAGIVTLNSTWLQLTGEDHRGRLHVDPRQLVGATGGDPVAWTRGHQVNILVSHQPTSWLHPTSVETWNSEIFPPGRFDVHLFGHMHEHAARSTTSGGSAARREIQAASVFGLETIKGKQERSHGYAVAQIGGSDSMRALTVWPRTLRTMTGGERKLVPDQLQELSEENNFSWLLNATTSPTTTAGAGAGRAPRLTMSEVGRPSAEAVTRIKRLRYHLPAARAHEAVRRIERAEADACLGGDGILWISCDWGLGEDGFLWSVLAKRGETETPIFRLDLQDFQDREQFVTGVAAELGCSFEQLCEHLSDLDSSILLLDSVPSPAGRRLGGRPPERDLEELCDIVREYAPSAKVVLRGRPRREEVRRGFVELKAFEEVDVADYVRAHALGGEAYTRPDDITTMWRHASGSPVRLDTMLRDLEVTSLTDLVSAEPEYAHDDAGAGVPATLAGALSELARSEVPVLDRAYRLLEALTALPRGEQLERMKRFLGPHPFFPNHARELAERGLIETVHLAGMTAEGGRASAKTLVVPRIVLETVRNRMSPDRRRDIDGKAIDLYFGDAWRTGGITNSLAGKRCSDPLCEPYEVMNACALVVRVVSRARDEDEQLDMEAAVRLASAFVEVLTKGDHFRSAALLCEQVIPLIPPAGNEQRLDVLRTALARAIRMLGRAEEARDLIQQVDRQHLNKSQRRQLDLQLALIHERLGDGGEAAKHAREVLKGGRADGMGIQAQTVLAEQIPERSQRKAALAELEGRARKREANTAANNIALTLAELDGSADHLNRVIENAEASGDFYNGARAIVKMMSGRGGAGRGVSSDEETRLIKAYQHLHNERGANLFDQSHDALWAIFRARGDHSNMLRLFRHSSLIWRLRRQENREPSYLSELTQIADAATSSTPALRRELAYYRARAAAALDRQDAARLAVPSS